MSSKISQRQGKEGFGDIKEFKFHEMVCGYLAAHDWCSLWFSGFD